MKPILTAIIILISNQLMAQKVELFSVKLNIYQNVRDFCISQNNQEAFFTIQSPFQEISQIAYIKKENNEWSKPELMPFSDSFMDLEPFLSVDGKRLFFVSDRPINDSIKVKKDFDIYLIANNLVK